MAQRNVPGKRRTLPKRKSRPIPRTAEQFFAMPDEQREQFNRVTHVIQKMRREEMSLTRAAEGFGLDRRKVIRLGGSAIRKGKNGRYAAKSYDRLLRVMVIPSLEPGGRTEVAVRDSRTASKLAVYFDAIHKYQATGDRSGLKKFKDLKLLDANGQQIPLLTDPVELRKLGSAGVLSFESLYAR